MSKSTSELSDTTEFPVIMRSLDALLAAWESMFELPFATYFKQTTIHKAYKHRKGASDALFDGGTNANWVRLDPDEIRGSMALSVLNALPSEDARPDVIWVRACEMFAGSGLLGTSPAGWGMSVSVGYTQTEAAPDFLNLDGPPRYTVSESSRLVGYARPADVPADIEDGRAWVRGIGSLASEIREILADEQNVDPADQSAVVLSENDIAAMDAEIG